MHVSFKRDEQTWSESFLEKLHFLPNVSCLIENLQAWKLDKTVLLFRAKARRIDLALCCQPKTKSDKLFGL